MTDRIVLEGMRFRGTHGVHEHEQLNPQAFDVDVELALNLQPAGLSDDLGKSARSSWAMASASASMRLNRVDSTIWRHVSNTRL